MSKANKEEEEEEKKERIKRMMRRGSCCTAMPVACWKEYRSGRRPLMLDVRALCHTVPSSLKSKALLHGSHIKISILAAEAKEDTLGK